MRILFVYKAAPWIDRHVLTSFNDLNASVDILNLRPLATTGVRALPINSMVSTSAWIFSSTQRNRWFWFS